MHRPTLTSSARVCHCCSMGPSSTASSGRRLCATPSACAELQGRADGECLPRHPPHVEPSFLVLGSKKKMTSKDVASKRVRRFRVCRRRHQAFALPAVWRGEQYLAGPTLAFCQRRTTCSATTASTGGAGVLNPGRCVTAAAAASDQGLTLVHFSAERKRFLWDIGCG
jgi:hypothetical protein